MSRRFDEIFLDRGLRPPSLTTTMTFQEAELLQGLFVEACSRFLQATGDRDVAETYENLRETLVYMPEARMCFGIELRRRTREEMVGPLGPITINPSVVEALLKGPNKGSKP